MKYKCSNIIINTELKLMLFTSISQFVLLNMSSEVTFWRLYSKHSIYDQPNDTENSTLLHPSCTIQQSIEEGCVHTKSVTALPSHFKWDPLWYSCHGLLPQTCPVLEVELSSTYGCQSHPNTTQWTTWLKCYADVLLCLLRGTTPFPQIRWTTLLAFVSVGFGMNVGWESC